MVPVTALVTTRNEALNIRACLERLVGLCAQVFVIDSESDDGTPEIAKGYPVELVSLPYEHGRIIPWIFQWGLDNLPIQNDWILLVEADQQLSDELKREIEGLFRGAGPQCNGYYIRRLQFFRGRPIRHGGYGRKYLLKLFRRSVGKLDELEQDTRVYVSGEVRRLRGWIVEDNAKEHNILFYLEKHLRYAEAFAREEYARRKEGTPWKGRPRLFGTPDERVLWLKTVYYRMPLYVRPLLYFVYRYFILMGFLDGRTGFVFHFLQAFWFRLIVDIRFEELLRGQQGAQGGR